MPRYFAKHVFDGENWRDNACIGVDDQGLVTGIDEGEKADSTTINLDGYVLPLIPNVHSHAFQRAMAGQAERRGQTQDSFWTWRELMYKFTACLTPDDVFHIARWLYAEMLKSGYGWVGEFHYLHHDADGKPYDLPAEMAQALIRAASEAGIGMTILPALYSFSGFGETAPNDGQKRFINSEAQYADILDFCVKQAAGNTALEAGLCFHSLRASGEQQRQNLCDAYPDLPVHIHISEQQKEVQDCLNWQGAGGLRPVEYLYNHCDVDARWTLIHATHLNEAECRMMANSGAIAGLCPTTEANLGDGLFPLADFLRQGGRVSIGSDSHISIDPVEELRWLEYGQRLIKQQRSISASEDEPSPARKLYTETLSAGAQSMGAKIGQLRQGCRADFMVLNNDHPCFDGMQGTDNILDRLIFARAAHTQAIAAIYTAGQAVVTNARHRDEEEYHEAYRKTLAKLNSC